MRRGKERSSSSSCSCHPFDIISSSRSSLVSLFSLLPLNALPYAFFLCKLYLVVAAVYNQMNITHSHLCTTLFLSFFLSPHTLLLLIHSTLETHRRPNSNTRNKWHVYHQVWLHYLSCLFVYQILHDTSETLWTVFLCWLLSIFQRILCQTETLCLPKPGILSSGRSDQMQRLLDQEVHRYLHRG